MKDIWLIRHAESESNTKREFIGGRSHLSPLTKKGEIQARNLGFYLADLSKKNPDYKDICTNSVFYSSCAYRAKSTAKIAMGILGADTKKLIHDDSLAELDQGLWEGEERSDAYSYRVMQLIKSQGVDFKPPDGESQRDVANRMFQSVITNICCFKERSDRIIIFTHGIAIKCLMWRLFGMNDSQIYLGQTNNCSITRFLFDGYSNSEDQSKLIWWNNNTQNIEGVA